jgi:type II restriction enzyme
MHMIPSLPETASVGLVDLIQQYKQDTESVYNTWFIGSDERMKAFRSIRRGVADTVQAISNGTFGNDFRGSPLEDVLCAITEQKQMFEGAAHPFYWKPKLRIPDIYENDVNQRRFGSFLSACLNATREEQLLTEMSRLAEAGIKGLGPAAATILYFLQPTLVPPFNTAIINGFNALFGTKLKLGCWHSYMAMREAIVQANNQHKPLLSKDLGAFAGLLFEIGTGRIATAANADATLAALQEKAAKANQRRHEQVLTDQAGASEHTRMQHLLIRLGRALKYRVHVARNDRHRGFSGEAFALMTTDQLPEIGAPEDIMNTISLIDVLWLSEDGNQIVCAFEIEKSTSIYSGILRMKDLAQSLPGQICHYYIVAPDSREQEVIAQLSRPSFRQEAGDVPVMYIPFGLLDKHCEALCMFGSDLHVLRKIARGRAAV